MLKDYINRIIEGLFDEAYEPKNPHGITLTIPDDPPINITPDKVVVRTYVTGSYTLVVCCCIADESVFDSEDGSDLQRAMQKLLGEGETLRKVN